MRTQRLSSPKQLMIISALVFQGGVYANDIPMVRTQYTPAFINACCEKPAPAITPIEQPAVQPAPPPPPAPEPAPVVAAAAPVKVAKIDSDKDGVYDDTDECPNTPRGYKVDKKGCPRSVTLQIQFATGESTLLPSADKDIKILHDFMVENPASKITIVGHTDNVGGKNYNQKLSEARANSLATRLVRDSIEKERISTAGKGLSQPIASNKKAKGRALNRRIEIKIS